MALRNDFRHEDTEADFALAYTICEFFLVRKTECTFTVNIYKSRNKWQERKGLLALDYRIGASCLTVDVSRNIPDQIYAWIKTQPGWENAQDAN
jgi:hypothetical protein